MAERPLTVEEVYRSMRCYCGEATARYFATYHAIVTGQEPPEKVDYHGRLKAILEGEGTATPEAEKPSSLRLVDG